MTALAAPLTITGGLRRWGGLVVIRATVLVARAGAAGGPHRAGMIAAGLAAVLLFVIAAARPAFALTALVIVLPAQLVVSAWLYHLGVPGSAAHALGNVKDVLVAALVARAVMQRPVRRLDTLDKVALGYVILLTAYLVVPTLGGGVLGSATWHVRLLEWRVLSYAALVVLAVRRLPVGERVVRRLAAVVLAVGLVVAGCAV